MGRNSWPKDKGIPIVPAALGQLPVQEQTGAFPNRAWLPCPELLRGHYGQAGRFDPGMRPGNPGPSFRVVSCAFGAHRAFWAGLAAASKRGNAPPEPDFSDAPETGAKQRQPRCWAKKPRDALEKHKLCHQGVGLPPDGHVPAYIKSRFAGSPDEVPI